MKQQSYFTSENFEPFNQAFQLGDAVKVQFFFKDKKLLFGEECYFFLMASMRKLKLKIPLSYTLDYFETLFHQNLETIDFNDGVIDFMVFNNSISEDDDQELAHSFSFIQKADLFSIEKEIEIDLTKEIFVNQNLLSNLQVHSPENIYAKRYAKENGLADVMMLNLSKRIARASMGNLLFLKDNKISVIKQSEGAYISPLMEQFVTYIHKENLYEIEPTEMSPFESQKADEILLVSDLYGLFSVTKIRNKHFGDSRFKELVASWRTKFL